MTVYADILILINTYVNFFVLLAASAFLRIRCRFLRLIMGALFGGICSLVILIEQKSEFLTCLIQLIIAVIIVLFAFGFAKIYIFLKRLALFFTASFLFSGCVYCYWLAFKPERLIINNSVIYFDISAVELIVASAAIYLLVIIVRAVNGGYAKNERKTVDLSICHRGQSAKFKCLIDTGNMLRDAFTDMPVAVIDRMASAYLMIDFFNLDDQTMRDNKIRLIPFDTVNGEGLMPIFKPDKITVDNREVDNILIGVSPCSFDGEYDAVANYDIIGET